MAQNLPPFRLLCSSLPGLFHGRANKQDTIIAGHNVHKLLVIRDGVLFQSHRNRFACIGDNISRIHLYCVVAFVGLLEDKSPGWKSIPEEGPSQESSYERIMDSHAKIIVRTSVCGSECYAREHTNPQACEQARGTSGD